MPGTGSEGDDLSFTAEYRKNEVKRMDFEKFKESLIEDVQQGLYEKGIEANVSISEVSKLNEDRKSVV